MTSEAILFCSLCVSFLTNVFQCFESSMRFRRMADLVERSIATTTACFEEINLLVDEAKTSSAPSSGGAA